MTFTGHRFYIYIYIDKNNDIHSLCILHTLCIKVKSKHRNVAYVAKGLYLAAKFNGLRAAYQL